MSKEHFELIQQEQNKNLTDLHEIPYQENMIVVTKNPAEALELLYNGTVSNIELVPKYWAAEKGDIKKLIYDGIVELENKDGGILKHAVFFESTDRCLQRIMNASKKLVGILENLDLPKHTTLEIAFLGMKQSTANAYKYSDWSIRQII